MAGDRWSMAAARLAATSEMTLRRHMFRQRELVTGSVELVRPYSAVIGTWVVDGTAPMIDAAPLRNSLAQSLAILGPRGPVEVQVSAVISGRRVVLARANIDGSDG